MKKIGSKIKNWFIKTLSAMGATSLIIVPTTTLTSCKKSATISDEKKNMQTKMVNAVNVTKKFPQEYSKTQFYNTYNNNLILKEFVSKNMSLFVNGNIDQIKENFNAKLISQNNELYLDLEIHSGYWYKDNKLQYETLKQQIKLYGFKNELLPELGGQFNNLNIDQNLKLVDVLLSKLKIDNNYNLSKITENELNNVYKNTTNYEKLTCKILDGSSTKEGVLQLHVQGEFNKSNYNSKIKISNFTKPVNDIYINNIKLNLNQWFMDLQPTQTINTSNITNISSSDFVNKYIDSASIQQFNSNHEIISFKQAKENGYKFEFNQPVLDKKNINFALRTKAIKYQHKKYQSGQWINDELISLNVKQPLNVSYVNIPKNDESLKYLLNQTTINEDILKDYYPSFFQAQAIYSNSIGINYPEINNLIKNNYIEQIKKTYYPNIRHLTLNIMNNPNAIYANDKKGMLEFSVQILLDNEKSIHTKRFIFNNKTKNINEFINQQKIANPNNELILRTDDSNHWGNHIIKLLKKNHKSTIDNFFNDKSKNSFEDVNTNLNLNWLSQLLHSIKVFSNDESWSINDPNLKKLFKNVSISDFDKDGLYVFGKEIMYSEETSNKINLNRNGALDTKTGLYKYDQNNEFIIRSINYRLKDNSNIIKVKHNNESLITIKIPYQIEVMIDDETIIQNSWMVLTLLKNNWNRIQ